MHPSFYGQFQQYQFPPEVYSTNNTLGGRLIPRSTVRDHFPGLSASFREILESPEFSIKRMNANTINVSPERISHDSGWNAVLLAWRNALYTMTIGVAYSPDASSNELTAVQKQVNKWQDLLRRVTPGGGAYMSEATFDNANWKRDYFGQDYNRLLGIKTRYDPNFILYQHTSVGANAYWEVAADGRLCRTP